MKKSTLKAGLSWFQTRTNPRWLRLPFLLLLLILWQVGSPTAPVGALPSPFAVLSVIVSEMRSGALLSNLAITFGRVIASFGLAMSLGTLLGVAMGRNKTIDRLFDPLLIVLLNLPALVVIVLAYIWIGLNDTAAITAVALNKLPNTAVTLREGSRALDKDLDEMAFVFHLPPQKKLRDIVIPQLAPYFAAAARSGLSLAWKIVLIVELLGRSNGVGFEIGIAFQLFDIARLLAYALPFIGFMLAIEAFIVQPFENHIFRWRSGRHA